MIEDILSDVLGSLDSILSRYPKDELLKEIKHQREHLKEILSKINSKIEELELSLSEKT